MTYQTPFDFIIFKDLINKISCKLIYLRNYRCLQKVLISSSVLIAKFHNLNLKTDKIVSKDEQILKINVPDLKGYQRIGVDEILYLVADSNYTHLHFKNGKKIIRSKTLKEFESKLNPNLFIRVHHSYIVNINEISSFNKIPNCSITMSNNQLIPVSRARKKQFFEKMRSM